jgi:hypothetical protein
MHPRKINLMGTCRTGTEKEMAKYGMLSGTLPVTIHHLCNYNKGYRLALFLLAEIP